MVVVYDADWRVCQASVAWVKKRDRRGVFELVGNDVPDLPPGVSREETGHTVIVLDGARKLVRAEAVARILGELPDGRRRARCCARRASAGGELAYDKFARNRHRVSEALGMRACAVPGRKS